MPLSVDCKEKPQSTIFNVQKISDFTASNILIQESTVCWPALLVVVDNDLGVSKPLICEAKCDSPSFFWGEKKLFTFLNSSRCSVLFHNLLLQINKMSVKKLCNKWLGKVFIRLYFRYQTNPQIQAHLTTFPKRIFDFKLYLSYYSF